MDFLCLEENPDLKRSIMAAAMATVRTVRLTMAIDMDVGIMAAIISMAVNSVAIMAVED